MQSLRLYVKLIFTTDMNQKIRIEIAIGIIFSIAILLGGLIWLGGKKQENVSGNTINRQEIENQKEEADNTSIQSSEDNFIGKCDNFGKESWEKLTSTERIRCMKEMSTVDENNYSRFSYFPEEIIVSGEYRKTLSSSKNSFSFLGFEGLCFTVNEKDESKLPNNPSYPRNTFCFINNNEAEIKFGTDKQLFDENKDKNCELSGRADIVISNYFIDNLESQVMTNNAKLERIIRKDQFKIECQ